MSRTVKFLIGLVAALVVGWVSHGPLGRGEAFVARMQAGAQAVLDANPVPGVTVTMSSRKAILSGPANQFQREGQGSLPGLNQRIAAVPGIAGVEWANPPPRP